jgi:hypothetical protein
MTYAIFLATRQHLIQVGQEEEEYAEYRKLMKQEEKAKEAERARRAKAQATLTFGDEQIERRRTADEE